MAILRFSLYQHESNSIVSQILVPPTLLLLPSLFLSGHAHTTEFDIYGSLRLQAESVNPDDEDQLNDYEGFRDTYSRAGVHIRGQITPEITGSIKAEFPMDLANGKLDDPFNPKATERVLKAQVEGDFGTLWIGKDWLAYYNAIAYPVDYFNSFYAGYATFTSFRAKDTVYYQSPNVGPFMAALSYSKEKGSDNDDRWQFTTSYEHNNFSTSIGIDSLGGENDTKFLGLATAYTFENWYIGTKLERVLSNSNAGYGENHSIAANLFVQKKIDHNTYKIMIAQVDNYGERIFHVGWEHKYSDSILFFAEYYYEEEQAAIAPERESTVTEYVDTGGGSALMFGIRYDFSFKRKSP